MLRFRGTRSIALALLLAAGCTKPRDADGTASTQEAASAAEGASAGAAARKTPIPTQWAPPDAAPAPPPPPVAEPHAAPKEFTYASIEDFLGLAGDEPPDTLAGFKLGDPPGKGYGLFDVTGFVDARTSAVRVVDGKVRHVTVELFPPEEPGLPGPRQRAPITSP